MEDKICKKTSLQNKQTVFFKAKMAKPISKLFPIFGQVLFERTPLSVYNIEKLSMWTNQYVKMQAYFVTNVNLAFECTYFSVVEAVLPYFSTFWTVVNSEITRDSMLGMFWIAIEPSN